MRAERNAGRPPQPLIIVFTSKRAADEGIACRFIFFFIESYFLLFFHQLTTLVENLTEFLFKFMPQVPPGGLVFYLKNFKIFGFKKNGLMLTLGRLPDVYLIVSFFGYLCCPL